MINISDKVATTIKDRFPITIDVDQALKLRTGNILIPGNRHFNLPDSIYSDLRSNINAAIQSHDLRQRIARFFQRMSL